jgi:hypothetical protein
LEKTPFIYKYCHYLLHWGHAVALLVDALLYKPAGRGFIGNFPGRNPSGADSAVIRNEYQEYFLGGRGVRCRGLTALPPKGFRDEKHSALQL